MKQACCFSAKTLWPSFCRIVVLMTLSCFLYFSLSNRRETTAPTQSSVIAPTLPPTTPTSTTLPAKYNATHAFITSAYYYRYSKSLGENALAMVIVMNQNTFENKNDLENYTLSIVSQRGNETLRSVAKIQTETPKNSACEYVMTLVQSTTLSDPESLKIESNNGSVSIPFKTPRSWSPSPVIICISPQFVAEKWQLFLMNIHVARRYGAHLHIYITSMVEELFNTLKVYEQWGSVTLDYWLRIKFQDAPELEPMSSVEWRNQAGAQTDCLLQYKEVAEFIAFFDIDEMLIPHLSQNYHQEFSTHFNAFPSYHSIFYMKRNVELEKISQVSKFSFRRLFGSMEVSNVTEYGKAVVDPLKYNSTWIHHSLRVAPNKMYTVLGTELLHVKGIVNLTSKNHKRRFPVHKNDMEHLDRDFQIAFKKPTFHKTTDKLVDHNYFGPIVYQCYNESFYHSWYVEKKGFDELCPNADGCKIPQRNDIKCIHSDGKYVSGPPMKPIIFHSAVEPFWSKDIGCYQ